jgi:hypothetical protein
MPPAAPVTTARRPDSDWLACAALLVSEIQYPLNE